MEEEWEWEGTATVVPMDVVVEDTVPTTTKEGIMVVGAVVAMLLVDEDTLRTTMKEGIMVVVAVVVITVAVVAMPTMNKFGKRGNLHFL
jgi:hypothetical protein